MAQRLRHYDQSGGFPPGKADGTGRLVLPARDRLQSAADDLGNIRTREQRDADQGANQTVDLEIARQEQRQHIGCKEQYGDQGNATPEFDKPDRKETDQRDRRASSERQGNPDRHGSDDAGDRNHQRHQKAAPQAAVDNWKATTVETHHRDHDADAGKRRDTAKQYAPSGAETAAEEKKDQRYDHRRYREIDPYRAGSALNLAVQPNQRPDQTGNGRP